MRAEKLFINGNIYTMDDEKTHAEALATTGQTILAVVPRWNSWIWRDRTLR